MKSKYLVRIIVIDLTNVISLAINMEISVKALRLDSGSSLKKFCIKLICMNLKMVLYLTCQSQ